MLGRIRSRLSFANVMATTAVFIALGGSSYAALKITGRNVPKNALTGADIKNLTGKDVRNNSLTGADVRGIGTKDVADGGLLAEDFAAGQLPQGPKGDAGPRGATGPAGPTAGAFASNLDDPEPEPTALFHEAQIIMPSEGRIYAQASVRSATASCAFSSTSGGASGNCTLIVGLYVDGQPVPETARSFGNSSASGASSYTTNIQSLGAGHDWSMFGLSAPVPAGTHTIALGAKLVALPTNPNTTGSPGPSGPSVQGSVGGIALGG